ncbi:MAG TPA: hypothetical protein VFF80_00825 [Bacillota bacterium]|nr:hypothetical protein [Bacillota bacterium]
MKARMRFLFLFLCLAFFISGCTLQVRPVIPTEHGTILNPNTNSQATPEKKAGENEEQPAAEKPDSTTTSEPSAETTKPLETNIKPSAAELDAAREEASGDTEAEISNEPPGPNDFSVKISPEQPDGSGEILLTVTGPANTPYTATFHFRTRNSVLKGYCGSPFTVVLGGATAGYKVEVDVSALIDGKLAKVTTSFTPK